MPACLLVQPFELLKMQNNAKLGELKIALMFIEIKIPLNNSRQQSAA